MAYSKLSKLEVDVIDAYRRFSDILSRLQNMKYDRVNHIEYDLKVKKSPAGTTHVSIRPQRGCGQPLFGPRYPNEIKIPEDAKQGLNYIIIEDTRSGLQKRFIKYLQRELPYVKIVEGEF